MVKLIAVVVVFVAATAFAAGQQGQVYCTVFDANGQYVLGVGHYVIANYEYGYPNPPGASRVVCHAQVDPPGEPVDFDYESTGVQCGAARDGSTTWWEHITPNGQATLVCWLPRGVY